MKFIKKVSFMVMSTALLSTVMVGCGSKVDVDQELVDSAAGAIVISGYTQVSSNLTAPRYVTKDGEKLEINWTEDSDSVEILDFDENTKKIVFTRPGVGAEAVAYSLTGTVELNGKTASKEISGYIMPYATEIIAYPTIQKMFDDVAASTLALGDEISFIGVVNNVISGSYWITDGTNNMLVYKSPDIDKIQLGDKIQVSGAFSKYKSTYQFKNKATIDILQRNVAFENKVTKISSADLVALDGNTDPTIHGKVYNVDLIIDAGSYVNAKTVDGTKTIQIYASPTASTDALKAFNGKTVNINVVYYTTYNTNVPRVTFLGGADDIKLVE